MKFIAKLILIILFIPVFFISIVSVTFKTKLLDVSFWQNAFAAHNVYANLSSSLKTTFENQVSQEGGSRSDAKVLTDLITPLNVKDLVDKNLTNLLGYMNGTAKELFVYVPYKLVPKSLLPNGISGMPQEIPIATFLMKFNITGIGVDQIKNISLVGIVSTYLTAISVGLLILFIFLLFLLTQRGERLIPLSVPLIISGFMTLSMARIGSSLSLAGGEIVSNVTGAIISELSSFWVVTGLVLIFLGVVLVFVRRP